MDDNRLLGFMAPGRDDAYCPPDEAAKSWYCEVCRPSGNGNDFAIRLRCALHGGEERYQPTNGSVSGFTVR